VRGNSVSDSRQVQTSIHSQRDRARDSHLQITTNTSTSCCIIIGPTTSHTDHTRWLARTPPCSLQPLSSRWVTECRLSGEQWREVKWKDVPAENPVLKEQARVLRVFPPLSVCSPPASECICVRILSCLQLMLKQEDLAFLKAISAARQSPALLRELRKSLSASKEKRTVALRRPVDSPRSLHTGSTQRGRPANWALIPPESLPRVYLLRSLPPGAARVPALPWWDRLLWAAWRSRDQRMPRWRPGALLCR
jgi:hypothetical protein